MNGGRNGVGDVIVVEGVGGDVFDVAAEYEPSVFVVNRQDFSHCGFLLP